jgi:shikimate kinase
MKTPPHNKTQPNAPPTKHSYAFFDTDDLIEKAHPGMAVADIFREHGEDYFRRCEAQVRAVCGDGSDGVWWW